MIDRKTKLRWRRNVRRGRRQVEDLGSQAEENLERHFFRRFGKLLDVRRFVIGWMLLVVLLLAGVSLQTRSLGGYYKTMRPVKGGTYSEGILGSFTNASPLYAAGAVNTSVSKLLFASLFKIDQNGALVSDLAVKYVADANGVKYTVTLRDKLTWHDGIPLTADDVVFTYRTIQNADAKSPLFSSWQGIKVEATNIYTVVFTLPNSLSAFPYSMTNGIVPKHILENVPVTQLRSVPFNTNQPVGSGPFMWNRVEVTGKTPETREEKVGLIPFDGYHEGKPNIDNFVVRSFRNIQNMEESFYSGALDAMVGLDAVPKKLKDNKNIVEYSVPLEGLVSVFLKTTSDIFVDVKVRQAVVQSIDQASLLNGLGFPAVLANSPILRSQTGYDKTIVQLAYDKAVANALLDSAGWTKGANGMRFKDKKPLTFTLVSQNTEGYSLVTKDLQKQWKSVGIDVVVQLQPGDDFQGSVSRHDYDALLYGIAIGPDPDVFAYWHSTQANLSSATRLNLSEYKSAVADKSLEAGRTRTDPYVRTVKYRPFLEAWRSDAPAIVLYQPRFYYLARSEVFGFNPRLFNEPSDRFSNVSQWMIRQQKIVN